MRNTERVILESSTDENRRVRSMNVHDHQGGLNRLTSSLNAHGVVILPKQFGFTWGSCSIMPWNPGRDTV